MWPWEGMGGSRWRLAGSWENRSFIGMGRRGTPKKERVEAGLGDHGAEEDTKEQDGKGKVPPTCVPNKAQNFHSQEV